MGATAKLRIQESFVSLQGEGGLVGVPSSFLRISGCNLRCSWCDTPDSSWNPQGEYKELASLLDFCAQGPRHVVITGGEPLLFAEVAELSLRLREAGHHITIETAGTVALEGLCADLLSISPKLQNSTPHVRAPHWVQRHENRRYKPQVLQGLLSAGNWQLKFVVQANQPEQFKQELSEIEAYLSDLDIREDQRDQVFLMPQAIDSKTLHQAYGDLVEICRYSGFRLGQRLHIDLFGHTPGT